MLRFYAVSSVSATPENPRSPPSRGEGPKPPSGSPEHLGPYDLLVELASGGMATVHLARATDRRRGSPLVAIKRPHRHLSADKTFVSMLVDEARLASAIEHPNVVKVRELGFDGGMPFIVMDYVEGASLAELRRELSAIGRTVDVRVAVRIALDALAGLHAAHQLKDDKGKPLRIVHRDVSPHNVLIGCDGRSRIADFGLAKAEDRIQTTRTHEIKGKLAYLAPERIDKRRLCTVQSDVFSMAVVLWECFAGRRLFPGDGAVDILQEVLSAPIPSLEQMGANIPPALDEVIARALSRDMAVRFATALDFARAIEGAADRENTGLTADVARLMEAVFGTRMALRQQQVRETVGAREVEHLLLHSGLPARDHPASTQVRTEQVLAELAPLAPIDRYAIRGRLRRSIVRLRWPAIRWWNASAVAAGIAIGVMVALAIVSGRTKRTSTATQSLAAIRAPASVYTPPRTRAVAVRLPFLATRVTFDALARNLQPATDTVVFEVPGDSAPRHEVTVVALDGSRAKGLVVEQDGVARPDSEGYVPLSPGESAEEKRLEGARAARSVGTIRDGFTKLR